MLPFVSKENRKNFGLQSILSSIGNKTLDLVLFSTEDGYSPDTIKKLKLFRSMCDIYASNYSFRAILFTKTQTLASALSDSSVIPVSDFEWASWSCSSVGSTRSVCPS